MYIWQQQCFIHVRLDFDGEPTFEENKKGSLIGKSCYIIKQIGILYAATCIFAVFRTTWITSTLEIKRRTRTYNVICNLPSAIVSLSSFIENPRSEISSAEKDEHYLRRSQSEHGEDISIADQVWRLLYSLEQNTFANSFHILESQFYSKMLLSFLLEKRSTLSVTFRSKP